METKFKCKDEVIYRYDDTCVWKYGIFSHYSGGYFCLVGIDIPDYCQILPYEGNQHLVGTTDSHKEELLKEGDMVVYSDSFDTLKKGFGKIGIFQFISESCFHIKDEDFPNIDYNYCVKFDDLTSPDRKDKIMRVNNGKIVKAFEQ